MIALQGSYVAVALNAYGFAVSFPATLELNYLPIIEAQTESPVFADPNSLVTLSVSASTSSPPLTMEWFFNGNPAFQDLEQPVESISFVAGESTTGVYTCIVSNAFESVEIEPIEVVLGDGCTANGKSGGSQQKIEKREGRGSTSITTTTRLCGLCNGLSGAAVALEFDPKLESHWNSGFTMNVTLDNVSPFDVVGWTVVWSFEEPGLTIDSFWRSTDLAIDSNNNLYSLSNDEFNQAS